MKESEFWNALEQVFTPALGRSLASDLYLPALGDTAAAALQEGVPPQRVWTALVDETDAGEAARWVHRQPRKREEV